MIDPTMIDHNDDDNSNDDDDKSNTPEAKEDNSQLQVNTQTYDLKDPAQAQQAYQDCQAAKSALDSGKLKYYEGKQTAWGGGGRSELLRDTIRAELAIDYHKGKHSMTWDQQDQMAHDKQQMVARIRAGEGKF